MRRYQIIILVVFLMFSCSDKSEDKTIYFDNGKIKVQYSLQNGQRNGLYTAFYENGNLKYRGEYRNNYKTGIHYGYDSMRRGKVISQVEYEMDGKRQFVQKITLFENDSISFRSERIDLDLNYEYDNGDIILKPSIRKKQFLRALIGEVSKSDWHTNGDKYHHLSANEEDFIRIPKDMVEDIDTVRGIIINYDIVFAAENPKVGDWGYEDGVFDYFQIITK